MYVLNLTQPSKITYFQIMTYKKENDCITIFIPSQLVMEVQRSLF
jgi:hypothetical protein